MPTDDVTRRPVRTVMMPMGCGVLLLSVMVRVAGALLLPAGPEFEVNTVTTGFQINPAVDVDAAGNFLVIWLSVQDDRGGGIFGQRYDGMGSPRGNEFAIDTVGTFPALAMAPAGNFVVVWQAADAGSFSIFGRRFGDTGVPLGAVFPISTSSGLQSLPDVAMDSAGDFVVVWNGNGPGDSVGIFGRRFDRTGAPQGAEFGINTYTTMGQTDPAVAMAPDGSFLVTWTGNGATDDRGVFGRWYTSAGSPKGVEFPINTHTAGFQENQRLAADGAGNFVVVWQSDDQDGDGKGIIGRRYDSTAMTWGPEFTINTSTEDDQVDPDVAADATGGFTVAWGQRLVGKNSGIFARHYKSTGEPDGNQLRVNNEAVSFSGSAAVASDGAGNVLVTWDSYQNSAFPDPDYGVFGRRFAPLDVPCGNGRLDAGEECDVGAANGAGGSCCSALCTFEPAGTVCRPPTMPCDAPETCSGSAAECPPDPLASSGGLDPTFGTGGKVLTPFEGADASARAIVQQADGKLVVVGDTCDDTACEFALVRYEPDGTLDTTFGSGGKVLTSFDAADANAGTIVQQPDGKLVVAGDTCGATSCQFALVRYDADGSPDPSFGIGGKVITPFDAGDAGAAALVLQPDGKLVAAGQIYGSSAGFALARYDADGALDPSFGDAGRITSFFGENGTAVALARQPDGKLVAAGFTDNDGSSGASPWGFALARYDVNGTADASFGTMGRVVTRSPDSDDFAEDMVQQPDGKLVVAGWAALPMPHPPDPAGFLLDRYDADGNLDPLFGQNGRVFTTFDGAGGSAYALVRQNDGKLIAAGETYGNRQTVIGVVRYDEDGTLDGSFGCGGTVTTAFGGGYALAQAALQQNDGRLVVAGSAQNGDSSAFALVRYLVDGEPLPTTTTLVVSTTTITTSSTTTSSTTTTTFVRSTTTTTTAVTSSTMLTTTSTAPAICTSPRCTVTAGLTSAGCAGQAIPAKLANTLTHAVVLIENADTASNGQATKLRRRARTMLKQARALARRAAKGHRPKISPDCSAVLDDAVERILAALQA